MQRLQALADDATGSSTTADAGDKHLTPNGDIA
jgi:hypothetical protein